MVKVTKKAVVETGTGLPLPFSREIYEEAVTNAFLFYVRNLCWMTDSETAWAVTKAPVPKDLEAVHVPEWDAASLGLTFEHLRNTTFAQAMERMYQYAYFGRLDLSDDPLEDETTHTFISAIVCDIAESKVAEEWRDHGHDVSSYAVRLMQVAETANARVMLEGGDGFFGRFKVATRDQYDESNGVLLTVRQMALLSGMEEMSIRAAANPSRANQLKPHGLEGVTRFDLECAKEWLKSKKRYVPITKFWSSSDLDLAKKRFANFSEMDTGLSARYKTLCLQDGRGKVDEQLKQFGIRTGEGFVGPFLELSEEDYANEATVRGIAQVLDLPSDLLVLRTKQVIALETLNRVERELRELEAN